MAYVYTSLFRQPSICGLYEQLERSHTSSSKRQCSGYSQQTTQIEEIIKNHSNAFYTVDQLYGDVFLLRPEVSKEKFLEHFEDYGPLIEQDLDTWKDLIERYPDQFMWGTDRGGLLWSVDREVGWTLADYSRAFIARLDSAVQEKFAYRNAEYLFQNR